MVAWLSRTRLWSLLASCRALLWPVYDRSAAEHTPAGVVASARTVCSGKLDGRSRPTWRTGPRWCCTWASGSVDDISAGLVSADRHPVCTLVVVAAHTESVSVVGMMVCTAFVGTLVSGVAAGTVFVSLLTGRSVGGSRTACRLGSFCSCYCCSSGMAGAFCTGLVDVVDRPGAWLL